MKLDKNIIKKHFGKKLQELIENKGIKKCDVSRELKIPFSTISNWCLGKAYPHLDSMVLLAEYFNIRYNDLVKIDNQKED